MKFVVGLRKGGIAVEFGWKRFENESNSKWNLPTTTLSQKWKKLKKLRNNCHYTIPKNKPKIWNSELKPLNALIQTLLLSLSCSSLLPSATHNCTIQVFFFFNWILVVFCSILFDLQLAAGSSILFLSFCFL